MLYFVECVGISYIPLHERAIEVAAMLNAKQVIKQIYKAKEKSRIGFKRRAVRC